MPAASAEEWEAAEEPFELILHSQCFDVRKRRLLSCACVSRILDNFSRPHFAPAIEFAESWADSRFDRDDWLGHRRNAARVKKPNGRVHPVIASMQVADAVHATLERPAVDWLRALEQCQQASGVGDPELEALEQCRLTRDIFPNPFLEFSFDPTWLKWNEGTVSKLAHAIYDDRHFEDLPVLGDALEEAGCSDPLILDHCRSDAEHVRGCWVVDLMTGRDNTSFLQSR